MSDDDPVVIYLDLEAVEYDDGSAAVFLLSEEGVSPVAEYTAEQVAEILDEVDP